MGNLNLKSDEPLILATQNVVVKSVSFEAILTDKRLILVDSRKDSIQSNDIPLEAIRTVEAGENAIRDPIITLSLITGTGEMLPLVLTFSQKPRERRRRECDEWAKKLKEQVASSRQEAARTTGEPSDQESALRAGRIKTPRTGIVRTDKTAVELSADPRKPVETSSLPFGVFCSRCGNRVPLGSEFCNWCGTKIITPQDLAAGAEPIAQPVPQPVVSQVSVPVPPVAVSPPERKERPIDEVIHSIEPLIADSVPRTEPAPPIPHQPVAPPAEGTPAAPAAPAYPPLPPLPGAPSRRPKYIVITALILVIVAVAGGAFLSAQFLQGKPDELSEPATTPTITTAATTIPTPAPQQSPTPHVTPQPSSPPQVIIPATGVWVRVNYPGTFTGLVGTPGRQQQVTDSGDRFYQISTSEGTVAVSIQKRDGSGNEIAVEVYKNGALVKRSTTTAPRGTIDLQVDLKTANPIGVTPAVTP